MVNVRSYFYSQGAKYPTNSQKAEWEFDELGGRGGHMHHTGYLAGPTSKESVYSPKSTKLN